MPSYHTPHSHLLAPGHTACAGCGMIVAVRHALDVCGRETIVCGATGCSEVTTTKYPTTSFKVPYIHSLFENPAAVASGIAAMLRRQKKEGVNILVHGGDGAFFDIGLGLISGSWARQENILFICYDNEAYMNTGVQASSATPHDSYTMTSPAGKTSRGNKYFKKDMPAIALAHGLSYVATATIGNLLDFDNKIKKALSFTGPKYIQVYCTCVPGWNTKESDTIRVARLAQQTGLYPVFEYEFGELASAMKVPVPTPRVEEFLNLQGRFRHLFGAEAGKREVAAIQALAEENIRKFGL
jgi:pyruvate ferredoxin oxidoreductase beta subunit